MQYSTIQFNKMHCITILFDAILYGTIQSIHRNTIHYNTMQNNTFYLILSGWHWFLNMLSSVNKSPQNFST